MGLRIITVARLAWWDMWKRNVGIGFGGIFLVVLVLPLWFMVHFATVDGEAHTKVLGTLGTATALATLLTVFVAAGSIDREIQQRTLSAVMIRPIARSEYLLGRTLGVITMFSQFCLLSVVAACGIGLNLDVSLTLQDFFAVFAMWCSGCCWITLALAIAAVSSFGTCVAGLIGAMVVGKLVDMLPENLGQAMPAIKAVIYYVSKMETPEQLSWKSGVALLDNFGYAAVVFIACAWLFEKNDIRLRA